MNKKIKKVLVTGGAGYIGTFVVDALRKEGMNPVIVDNFTTGHKKNVTVPYYDLDLLDKDRLVDLFEKERFDAVIHLASLTLPSESMRKPGLYFAHNLQTTINVLEAMAKTKTPYIIFSSSCSVYGTPKITPVTEETSVHPESAYAATKVQTEILMESYRQIYGIQHVSLRYFNACGAALDGNFGEKHDPETHLIPNAINALIKKKRFVLNGNTYKTKDGTCIRDFVHVLDVASAHIYALAYLESTNKSNIFNIGSNEPHSVMDILNAIEKIYGKLPNITIAKARSGDPAYISANISKAKRLLKWHPCYSDLETIIRSSLLWHAKNYGTVDKTTSPVLRSQGSKILPLSSPAPLNIRDKR